MPDITLQLPELAPGEHVEVLVRVGQTERQYSYRVEILPWSDCDPAVSDRVQCLQRIVREHQPEYQLVQIGSATESHVQVTFQQVGGAHAQA